MAKLIQLPEFSYTSLDFDTIINDVQALIREHPEYNNEWDDFLESNAGRMFVEITSFIVEKLAARVDWNSRELFVSTATQRQSLINLLKLINHRPELPKSSKVSIKMKLTKWVESFSLNPREQILGFDVNGNAVKFECMELSSDGKPNYDFIYSVDTGDTNNRITEIFNIPFYEGTTIVENDIWMEGIDNEEITLNRNPVIENSIRIYSITDNNKEFIEVESFISPEAQQNELDLNGKTVPFIIEIDASNNAIVKFSSASLVKTPSKDERLEIKYRVGGGANTNIVSNSINQTKTYNINNERTTIIYTNPDPATGGADEEDLFEARLTAPLTLRSANKTVTNEDYVSHLEDLETILKVSIIGKENEPSDIYDDYGYFLPSLETWIYVALSREWAVTSPKLYNKTMIVSRPYRKHDWIDYEDISISTEFQTVNLVKLRKYLGFTKYVTLFENTQPEGIDWMATDSYVEGVDYEIDEVRSEFTRIQGGDGGNIPEENRTLRILYVYDSTWEEHRDNTIFELTTTVLLDDTQADGIYPAYKIAVQSKDLLTTYVEGTDYSINYSSNVLTRIVDGNITSGDKVIIRYANHWAQDQEDLSEEKDILSSIENKKMICVDNKVKDSRFGTFDITATIYCYKNMRTNVENGIEDYVRNLYTLDKRNFWENIRREEIAAEIMSFEGVRYAEITYLGRDYVAYRKESLSQIDSATLLAMDGVSVEHNIECKYNEILVVAEDEWEGVNQVTENKRHGLIFQYRDA